MIALLTIGSIVLFLVAVFFVFIGIVKIISVFKED